MSDKALRGAARSTRSAFHDAAGPFDAASHYTAGSYARRDAADYRRADYRGADDRAMVPASRPRVPAVTPRRQTSAPAPAASYSLSRIFPRLFTLGVLLALWIGWLNRDDTGLTPVSGIGYWLGIAGSTLMLLLLVYPLRKRMRSLRAIGSVSFWFNTHMILGILGPVLVMWHANFHLGSINCSVALVTMLVVAGSGIIGRYLHSQVNSGFHGRKAEAREVTADADELRGFLGAEGPVADRMVALLNAYTQFGTAPRGFVAGLVILPVVRWRGTALRRGLIAKARKIIASEGRRRGRSREVQRRQLAGVTEFVTRHVGAAAAAATLAVYERLFRLWHIFHLPLFAILVIVAIVHVYASHFF
jgi:hypothetical protein